MKFGFASFAAALLAYVTLVAGNKPLTVDINRHEQPRGITHLVYDSNRYLKNVYLAKRGEDITSVVNTVRDGKRKGTQVLYTAPYGGRVYRVFAFGDGGYNLVIIYASDQIKAWRRSGKWFQPVRSEKSYLNRYFSVENVAIRCTDDKFRDFDVMIDTQRDPRLGQFKLYITLHGKQTALERVLASSDDDAPVITYDDFLQDVSLTGYRWPKSFLELVADERLKDKERRFQQMLNQAKVHARHEEYAEDIEFYMVKEHVYSAVGGYELTTPGFIQDEDIMAELESLDAEEAETHAKHEKAKEDARKAMFDNLTGTAWHPEPEEPEETAEGTEAAEATEATEATEGAETEGAETAEGDEHVDEDGDEADVVIYGPDDVPSEDEEEMSTHDSVSAISTETDSSDDESEIERGRPKPKMPWYKRIFCCAKGDTQVSEVEAPAAKGKCPITVSADSSTDGESQADGESGEDEIESNVSGSVAGSSGTNTDEEGEETEGTEGEEVEGEETEGEETETEGEETETEAEEGEEDEETEAEEGEEEEGKPAKFSVTHVSGPMQVAPPADGCSPTISREEALEVLESFNRDSGWVHVNDTEEEVAPGLVKVHSKWARVTKTDQVVRRLPNGEVQVCTVDENGEEVCEAPQDAGEAFAVEGSAKEASEVDENGEEVEEDAEEASEIDEDGEEESGVGATDEESVTSQDEDGMSYVDSDEEEEAGEEKSQRGEGSEAGSVASAKSGAVEEPVIQVTQAPTAQAAKKKKTRAPWYKRIFCCAKDDAEGSVVDSTLDNGEPSPAAVAESGNETVTDVDEADRQDGMSNNDGEGAEQTDAEGPQATRHSSHLSSLDFDKGSSVTDSGNDPRERVEEDVTATSVENVESSQSDSKNLRDSDVASDAESEKDELSNPNAILT
ncbi:hypothetical protein, conserved [Babesia ovata]|uniref:Uncharacterized protein n=1 Tax=Babesia ovata TaxID=189622 RepID=A0A2H6KBY8_9APIC|nr:uncharacterized protein BOVATA_019980 [Babesia ovata]GBE60505.1 hypothetical protein, conserved [Babesia ovata]